MTAGSGIAPVSALDSDIPVTRAERKLLGISASMWPRIIAPVVLGVAFLALWTIVVRARDIPPYILPDPILVAKTLVSDWPSLSSSLWITLSISLAALTAAVVVGVSLAILFTQSKWLELSLFPTQSSCR